MIPASTILAHFQRMLAEAWPYEWGAARTGCVDCSGAFVWAYRQEGERIYHGSNRIAREYIVELLPISEAQPGMAAFKARRPGEDYYSLPQGYLPGGGRYNGDLNDYHHIGLVDDDPAYVLNAKSTAEGFKRSRITENWDYVARLKAVRYDDVPGDGEPVGMDGVSAYVETPDGNPVKLRKDPSTKNPYIDKVPNGDSLTVLEQAQGWATVVTSNGTRGYMMSEFIRLNETVPDEPLDPVEDEDEDEIVIRMPRYVADALYTALQKAGWS